MVDIIHTLDSKNSFWISEDELKTVKYGFHGRISKCGTSQNVYGIDVHLPYGMENSYSSEFTLIEGLSIRHAQSNFVDALTFVEYTSTHAEKVKVLFDGCYNEVREPEKFRSYRPMNEDEIREFKEKKKTRGDGDGGHNKKTSE